MTVYVDDMRAKFGQMIMCHMLADTTEELLAMADTIGVARKWIQYPGLPREHFDIALSKRALAVKAGAKEITWREAGKLTLAKYRAIGKLNETPSHGIAPIDDSADAHMADAETRHRRFP